MSLRLRLKCHLQLAFGAAVTINNPSDQLICAQHSPSQARLGADENHEPQTSSNQSSVTSPDLIDATGLICPLPLLKLKQALHHLNPGETLIMSVDDPNSVRDSERFCTKQGFEFSAKTDHEQRTICHLWVTKPVH